MKNSNLNNPDMKSSKEWNLPDDNWQASSDITDEVKSGVHEIPCPPKKSREEKQGLKLKMIPILFLIVYILCKMMKGAIEKRSIKKVDRVVVEIGKITEQNQ